LMMKGAANRFRSGGTNSKIDRAHPLLTWLRG